MPVFPVQDGISESAGRFQYECRSSHAGKGHEALVRRMVGNSESHLILGCKKETKRNIETLTSPFHSIPDISDRQIFHPF